jgi:hypothetical protein
VGLPRSGGCAAWIAAYRWHLVVECVSAFGCRAPALRAPGSSYPDVRRGHRNSQRGLLSSRGLSIRTCCGMPAATSSPTMVEIPEPSKHYLGHRNIHHTVRYSELTPERFKKRLARPIGGAHWWFGWWARKCASREPERGRPLFSRAEQPRPKIPAPVMRGSITACRVRAAVGRPNLH